MAKALRSMAANRTSANLKLAWLAHVLVVVKNQDGLAHH